MVFKADCRNMRRFCSISLICVGSMYLSEGNNPGCRGVKGSEQRSGRTVMGKWGEKSFFINNSPFTIGVIVLF